MRSQFPVMPVCNHCQSSLLKFPFLSGNSQGVESPCFLAAVKPPSVFIFKALLPIALLFQISRHQFTMLDTLCSTASIIQQAINSLFHFFTAYYFQDIHDPSLSSRAMKNIVILGGSYAGVSTAHRILKQRAKLGPFKITLVSPDTHFYWSMASARGILPGQFADETLFEPVAAGFDKYPASQFEFILASAEKLDVQAKKVEIADTKGQRKLDYDYLILATGSRTKNGTPLKGLGSTQATKDALHDFQTRIRYAETIVVAGGGVTSIEIAGELAYEYGRQKEVILVSFHPSKFSLRMP